MAAPNTNEVDRARLARFDALAANMWGNELKSDLTLKCKATGKEFKVHKVVVCGQSKPLAAAMNGKWKESESAFYEFTDEDEETVGRLVDFLYKQESIPNPSPDVPNETMLWITKVYIIADKYDIKGLKDLAIIRFREATNENAGIQPNDWSDKSLHKAIRLMYEETANYAWCLKHHAISFVVLHPQILDLPQFRELLQDIGQIGLDLAIGYKAVLEYSEAQKPILWDGFCVSDDCSSRRPLHTPFEYVGSSNELLCKRCYSVLSIYVRPKE